MRGLMAGSPAMKAGAHMPQRQASGGNRTAPSTHTARNGKQTGSLKANGTSDTRRRYGPEGNGKGSPPTKLKSPKPASLQDHKGTSGRGGKGESKQTDANRLSESPGSAWFEKLGC
jgi:hypothetical protein